MKPISWVAKTAILTGRTHYMDARQECPIEIQDLGTGDFPFVVVYECSVYARVKTLETAKKWARKLRLKIGKVA